MQRRHILIALTAAASSALPFAAQAQVTDLNDAINKAGRQRMLSQRMGKAWLALVLGRRAGRRATGAGQIHEPVRPPAGRAQGLCAQP
jgi:hypothetical protein